VKKEGRKRETRERREQYYPFTISLQPHIAPLSKVEKKGGKGGRKRRSALLLPSPAAVKCAAGVGWRKKEGKKKKEKGGKERIRRFLHSPF